MHMVNVVMCWLEDECWILIKAEELRCSNDFAVLFNMAQHSSGRHAYRLPLTLHISPRQSVLKVWLDPSSPCIPPVNCSYVIYGVSLLPVSPVCFGGCSAMTWSANRISAVWHVQPAICLRLEFLKAGLSQM